MAWGFPSAVITLVVVSSGASLRLALSVSVGVVKGDPTGASKNLEKSTLGRMGGVAGAAVAAAGGSGLVGASALAALLLVVFAIVFYLFGLDSGDDVLSVAQFGFMRPVCKFLMLLILLLKV